MQIPVADESFQSLAAKLCTNNPPGRRTQPNGQAGPGEGATRQTPHIHLTSHRLIAKRNYFVCGSSHKMDKETSQILSKILGKRDLDKVPSDILAKVEKFYDQRFEEFLTTKALCDIAQRNVGK